MGPMADSAYAEAGVDTSRADTAVAALVGVLRTIDLGRESRAVLGSGHYANVLRIAEGLRIAPSTGGGAGGRGGGGAAGGGGGGGAGRGASGRRAPPPSFFTEKTVNDVICVGA